MCDPVPRRRLFGPAMKVARPVRGILFGLEEVLLDTTSWQRWLVQLLRNFGFSVRYDRFGDLWKSDDFQEVQCGRRKPEEATYDFLLKIGLSANQATEIELACRAKRRQAAEDTRPCPGVRNTLTKLHDLGLVLGVLSDSEHSGTLLWERFERYKLASCLSSVVSSRDVGRTKPNAEGYLRVLKEMQTSPHETAFVGHHPDELRGAAGLGMTTIAIGPCPWSADVSFQLERFEELIDWILSPTDYADAG